MIKKILFVFAVLSMLHIHAQKKVNLEKKLADYHIAMEDEMSGQELDFKRLKLYLDDGTVIKKRYLKQYDNPEKYDKLIYLDEEGNIRAYVFTKIEDFPIANTETDIFLKKKKNAVSFYVTDIYGKTFYYPELKNKVIVMNFWDTTCGPCVKEMPDLNKLVAKYKGKDVIFLAFTENVKSSIINFISKFSFDYHLIPNSQIEMMNYRIKALPTHIIINKKGKIVFREQGVSYDTSDNIDKAISILLSE